MSKQSEIPRLTRLKDWAEASGVDYQQAYNLAREGHIDAVQLGQSWFVVGTGLPDQDGECDGDEDDVSGNQE